MESSVCIEGDVTHPYAQRQPPLDHQQTTTGQQLCGGHLKPLSDTSSATTSGTTSYGGGQPVTTGALIFGGDKKWINHIKQRSRHMAATTSGAHLKSNEVEFNLLVESKLNRWLNKLSTTDDGGGGGYKGGDGEEEKGKKRLDRIDEQEEVEEVVDLENNDKVGGGREQDVISAVHLISNQLARNDCCKATDGAILARKAAALHLDANDRDNSVMKSMCDRDRALKRTRLCHFCSVSDSDEAVADNDSVCSVPRYHRKDSPTTIDSREQQKTKKNDKKIVYKQLTCKSQNTIESILVEKKNFTYPAVSHLLESSHSPKTPLKRKQTKIIRKKGEKSTKLQQKDTDNIEKKGSKLGKQNGGTKFESNGSGPSSEAALRDNPLRDGSSGDTKDVTDTSSLQLDQIRRLAQIQYKQESSPNLKQIWNHNYVTFQSEEEEKKKIKNKMTMQDYKTGFLTPSQDDSYNYDCRCDQFSRTESYEPNSIYDNLCGINREDLQIVANCSGDHGGLILPPKEVAILNPDGEGLNLDQGMGLNRRNIEVAAYHTATCSSVSFGFSCSKGCYKRRELWQQDYDCSSCVGIRAKAAERIEGRCMCDDGDDNDNNEQQAAILENGEQMGQEDWDGNAKEVDDADGDDMARLKSAQFDGQDLNEYTKEKRANQAAARGRNVRRRKKKIGFGVRLSYYVPNRFCAGGKPEDPENYCKCAEMEAEKKFSEKEKSITIKTETCDPIKTATPSSAGDGSCTCGKPSVIFPEEPTPDDAYLNIVDPLKKVSDWLEPESSKLTAESAPGTQSDTETEETPRKPRYILERSTSDPDILYIRKTVCDCEECPVKKTKDTSAKDEGCIKIYTKQDGFEVHGSYMHLANCEPLGKDVFETMLDWLSPCRFFQ